MTRIYNEINSSSARLNYGNRFRGSFAKIIDNALPDLVANGWTWEDEGDEPGNIDGLDGVRAYVCLYDRQGVKLWLEDNNGDVILFISHHAEDSLQVWGTYNPFTGPLTIAVYRLRARLMLTLQRLGHNPEKLT